jgi:putative transposase
MPDYSISQAAEILGISEAALRTRKGMQSLRQTADFRPGPGRTRLYPIDAFPADIQAQLSAQVAPTPAPPPTPAITSRSPELAAYMELQVAQTQYCQRNGIGKVVDCDSAFAAAINAGEISLSPETLATLRYGSKSGISRSTLARMRSRAKNGQLDRQHKGNAIQLLDSDTELRDFLVGTLYSLPHIGGTKLHRLAIAQFPGKAIPQVSTINRWKNAYIKANAAKFTLLTHPDQYKNRYMVALGSQSQDVTAPNELWELDSTPADVMLQGGRHSIIGVVDVFTRRAKLLVSKTSKAEAIQSLMRSAMLDWGIPASIKTDNGKDYASKAIANSCHSLGIWQEFCPPFQPWHKPHIERFFGTFSHDDLELLPNFIGHNVDDRQAIRSRQSFADHLLKKNATVELDMTAEQFQAFCDQWLDRYHNRAHGGLSNKTPLQVYSAASAVIRKITDRHQLDMLLAEQRQGTVTKQGIRFANTYFIAAELGAHVGDKLTICTDAQDVGVIHLFNADGFVCEAQAPERLGHDRREVAEAAKRIQTEANKAHRKAINKLKRQAKDGSLVDALTSSAMATPVAAADQATVSIDDRKSGDNVIAFPAPSPQPPELPLADRMDALYARVWQAYSSGDLAAITSAEATEAIAQYDNFGGYLRFYADMDKAQVRSCLAWLADRKVA